MKKILLSLALTLTFIITNAQKVIWKIGEADNQATGLALAPGNYKEFLANDFGWEDQYFLIGYSKAEKNFPYVLPGPKDGWGGTAPTAGIRSHLSTVLFDLTNVSPTSTFKLIIDLVGYNGENLLFLRLVLTVKAR